MDKCYFVFQTPFRRRGGYSETNTGKSTLFRFYHDNKIELIVFLYRRTKYVNLWRHTSKTAVAVAPSWFFFFLISHMLIRNIQGKHHIWNVKSTCYWHDFELQMHRFLHIVSKGEMCITSHSPVWRSMVYRRIMTAAFLWSLQ